MGFAVIAYFIVYLFVCVIALMISSIVFFVVSPIGLVGLVWAIREWALYTRE